MKKILLLLFILIISAITIQAQETTGHLKKPKNNTYLSVELGRSYFKDEVSDPLDMFRSQHFNTPTFGVLIEHELNPRLSIETGIAFRRFRTSLRSECDVLNTETSIFQVPLRLNYTLWEKGRFKLKAFTGINVSFQDVGRSGRVTGSELSYNFQSDGPAVIIAPELGLKLDYQVNKRMKLGVFASYVWSNHNLDRTIINYTVEDSSPIQAITNTRGSYFQAGFRVSYRLGKN